MSSQFSSLSKFCFLEFRSVIYSLLNTLIFGNHQRRIFIKISILFSIFILDEILLTLLISLLVRPKYLKIYDNLVGQGMYPWVVSMSSV